MNFIVPEEIFQRSVSKEKITQGEAQLEPICRIKQVLVFLEFYKTHGKFKIFTVLPNVSAAEIR